MVKDLNKIKKDLQYKEKLELCAREFGVIGSVTRLKICFVLCNYPELSVNEIARVVGVSPSAVSHSLSKLKDVQVVKSRRENQTIFYSLQNNKFTKLILNRIERSF